MTQEDLNKLNALSQDIDSIKGYIEGKKIASEYDRYPKDGGCSKLPMSQELYERMKRFDKKVLEAELKFMNKVLSELQSEFKHY